MKKQLSEIIWGKNNKFNGLIALVVVGSIVLGCTCGKGFNTNSGTDTSANDSTSNSPFGKDNPFSKNTGTQKAPDAPKDTNFTKADASKKQIPVDAELQQIVKTTLLDFNDALQKSDFSDFHTRISKVWQKQTNPEQLKSGFQAFIDGKTDISEIKSMDATFTTPPNVSKDSGYDMLAAIGEYETSGIKTTFTLKYVAEGKEWKLSKINVYAKIQKKIEK